MILRRKSDLIAAVAARWKEQYWHAATGWQHELPHSSKSAIYTALCALSPDATEDDVVRIIGNRSWTSNICNECEQDKDAVVILGQEEDYESRTAYVCIDCLQRAVVYFEDTCPPTLTPCAPSR